MNNDSSYSQLRVFAWKLGGKHYVCMKEINIGVCRDLNISHFLVKVIQGREL